MEETTKLTKRERETLFYVAKGYTNTKIAQIMFVSNHTIKQHILSAMRKLNAKNRANLAVIAVKKKYIEYEI